MIRQAIVCFFLFLAIAINPALAADNNVPQNADTLIKAAFQESNVEIAVKTLLDQGVSVIDIISGAVAYNVSIIDVVAALLKADGLDQDELILEIMLGVDNSTSALTALNANGINPKTVLTVLVKNNLDTNLIVATGEFMTDSGGYTQAQVYRALLDDGATYDTLVAVKTQLGIPVATIIKVTSEYNASNQSSSDFPLASETSDDSRVISPAVP